MHTLADHCQKTDVIQQVVVKYIYQKNIWTVQAFVEDWGFPTKPINWAFLTFDVYSISAGLN